MTFYTTDRSEMGRFHSLLNVAYKKLVNMQKRKALVDKLPALFIHQASSLLTINNKAVTAVK